MADGQTTPEKQLLKLIEGAEGAPAAAEASAKLKRKGLSLFSWPARLSFFRRSAKKKIGKTRKKLRVDFGSVNRVLTVVTAALVLYVTGDTVASAINMKGVPQFALQNEQAAPYAPPPAPALKEASYYLQKVNSRDIFKEVRRIEKKKPVPAVASNETKSLSLVGISWSSNPDAIVEDKDKQKTYFVKRGQMIGNVKVEAIFKDKVVLSKDGQEFELR